MSTLNLHIAFLVDPKDVKDLTHINEYMQNNFNSEGVSVSSSGSLIERIFAVDKPVLDAAHLHVEFFEKLSETFVKFSQFTPFFTEGVT